MGERLEFVRVRIPVITNENGDWRAIGWPGLDDTASAFDGLEPEEGCWQRLTWVEAEVPLPAAVVTVPGLTLEDDDG